MADQPLVTRIDGSVKECSIVRVNGVEYGPVTDLADVHHWMVGANHEKFLAASALVGRCLVRTEPTEKVSLSDADAAEIGGSARSPNGWPRWLVVSLQQYAREYGRKIFCGDTAEVEADAYRRGLEAMLQCILRHKAPVKVDTARIRELEAEVEKWKGWHARIHDERRELQAEIAERKKKARKCDNCAGYLGSCSDDCPGFSSQIGDHFLREQKQELEAEVERLKAAKSELLSDAKAEIDRLREENKQEVARLKQQLAESKQDRKGQLEEARSFAREVDELKQQLASHKSEQEEIARIHSVVVPRNDELREQLAEAQRIAKSYQEWGHDLQVQLRQPPVVAEQKVPEQAPAKLSEWLKSHPHQGFSKRLSYNRDGDFMAYFAKDERCFAETIDEVLSIYKSLDGEAIVGVKVCGIGKALDLPVVAEQEKPEEFPQPPAYLGCVRWTGVCFVTQINGHALDLIDDCGWTYGGIATDECELVEGHPLNSKELIEALAEKTRNRHDAS